MLANREVAFVNNVVDYVHAIFEGVIHKRWLAIFDLVKGRLFRRSRVNVGKPVIVVDGRYTKRLFVLLELVIEFQRMERVLGAKTIALVLRGFDLKGGSFPELVHIGCGHKARRSAGRSQQFFVRGFDENLEVGLRAFRACAIKGVDIP
jgi:hypothetical protein